MFNKKHILILILYLVNASVYSQQIIEKKWKFAFQLDNRFSSIKNNDIVIFGAKAGIQFKHLTRFGLGASFLLQPASIEYFNKKTKLQETNMINLWYISVFNDWIIYKSEHWECFVTEQIGMGTPSFKKEINDEIVSDINIRLFVNEFSGQVNYKFNKWLGLGTGFGYRNVLNPDVRLKNTLNAPIYILKIVIDPDVFFNK